MEPAAGNDLADLLERYGDRFSFIGNMDCSRLLSYGTPQEVHDEVKRTLEIGMSGKNGWGYVFSPCTDFINTNTLENAEAMMAAWKKYSYF